MSDKTSENSARSEPSEKKNIREEKYITWNVILRFKRAKE